MATYCPFQTEPLVVSPGCGAMGTRDREFESEAQEASMGSEITGRVFSGFRIWGVKQTFGVPFLPLPFHVTCRLRVLLF